MEGLPQTIVRSGFVDIIERPGMGVDLVPEKAKRYLAEDDRDFFDRRECLGGSGSSNCAIGKRG